MSTVSLSLDEIFELAKKTLLANGCDDETASILSDLIRNAERDGSLSHGLFRLPAYVSGLKSAAYGIVIGGFLPLLAVPFLEKYVTKSKYHTVVGDHEDLKKDLKKKHR